MTYDTPPALHTYKRQLHAAIERDLARGTRARRLRQRTLTLSAPIIAATATVTTLLLTAGGAAGPSLADAAILRHIRSALTAPAGMIVHQKAMISRQRRTRPAVRAVAVHDRAVSLPRYQVGTRGVGCGVGTRGAERPGGRVSVADPVRQRDRRRDDDLQRRPRLQADYPRRG